MTTVTQLHNTFPIRFKGNIRPTPLRSGAAVIASSGVAARTMIVESASSTDRDYHRVEVYHCRPAVFTRSSFGIPPSAVLRTGTWRSLVRIIEAFLGAADEKHLRSLVR